MTATSTTTYASRGMRHRRPRRSVVPILALLVIWASAAGVLALWWSDTTSVVGPAGWLTGAGRITGLLAGYGCAVLLALMAPVPRLDHTIGTDPHARWHAVGGRCNALIEPPLGVAEGAAERRLGHQPQSDLVRYRHQRARRSRQCGEQAFTLRLDIAFRQHHVAQP